MHEQVLGILAQMGQRPHTASRSMEIVARIHRTYFNNMCAVLEAAGVAPTSEEWWNRKIGRESYMPGAKRREAELPAIPHGAPGECSQCESKRNCISGAYCTKLNCYIEHDKQPRCKTI